MSGTTAVSGRSGKAVVDGALIARVTQWSAQFTAGDNPWGDSDSQGYTNRLTGRRDCTGTIEGKFDTSTQVHQQFVEGDIVKLVLWIDTTRYYVFPSCEITNFQITSNQDGQEPVGWSANFGADGIYYAPGQSGAPTETLPS